MCCLVYLCLFVGLTVIFNPDYTFETVLIRATSTLALLLLHIILGIGPLTRINSKFLPLLYNRRHLGVTMFIVAAIHGGFSLVQFHSLGNLNPLLSLFESNTNYRSFTNFPFQSLGFFALIIFFLMAVTSHDFWLNTLGPTFWKTLHMFVYLGYFLVILHVLLGVIQFETNALFVILLAVGMISLIVLHLIAGSSEFRKDHLKYPFRQAGFVKVCLVGDIMENRARMFCIDQERIAVFRVEGKLFAVNNVCKHQHGPLGEGQIVDGCITCPWHGYQYLPQNGVAPPPFKEKVSTYDVRIEDGAVWLMPKPYPEGTERPGAIIPPV